MRDSDAAIRVGAVSSGKLCRVYYSFCITYLYNSVGEMNMVRSIPKVSNGALHMPTDEESFSDLIQPGSAEWYTWLENSRSFRFETSSLSFTARQEQRPGGRYWYAYRRLHGKLHIAYLGKSCELSAERLNVVAAFLAEDSIGNVTQHSLYELKEAVLQLQEPPTTAFQEVLTQVEEKRFAHLWVQGQVMTPQQALAIHEDALLSKQAATIPDDAVLTSPGLTHRESDVLCFLTKGFTSTQIARELVISLSTVNTHIRSIYNKLGVTSRSAATRYALEHHLV